MNADTKQGQISYPYSMRELVSIATHLDRFPDDGVGNVVRSVFDFDSYDHDMRKLVCHTVQCFVTHRGQDYLRVA